MNHADRTTRVADRLFEPYHGLIWSFALIQVWLVGVFGDSVDVPGWSHGYDHQECENWAWDQLEKGRFSERVDVVPLEIWRQSEL